MAEVRATNRPGLFGYLAGRTLDKFGIENGWDAGSTNLKDATLDTAGAFMPVTATDESAFTPQVPPAISAIPEVAGYLGGLHKKLLDTGKLSGEESAQYFPLIMGLGGAGRWVGDRLDARALKKAGEPEAPPPAEPAFYANGDPKTAVGAFASHELSDIPFDLPGGPSAPFSYSSGSSDGYPLWTPSAEASSPYVATRKDGTPKTTVKNAQRQEFPGIYKRPDVIAAEANARVAPETDLMYNLFGVSRRDLADIGRTRVGNADANIPFSAKPRGSAAVDGIMTKANTNRLQNILGELEDSPLADGMDGWYVMDPAYKRLEELVGPEEAKKRYTQFNTLTGMASPGSEVLTELNRGAHANYLFNLGRFGDFKKFGGLGTEQRGFDFPKDMREIMGHPYHSTSQAGPMERFLQTGNVDMTTGKVPAYIRASGVPQTGFQTSVPVADAHYSKGIGLADTRTNADYGSSASVPEIQTLTPWWRQIAKSVGLEAVPGQARLWGALAPQTGVSSPIGAPKLELLSQKIKDTADAMRLPIDAVRDKVLKGELPLYANGSPFGAASSFLIPPLEQEQNLGAFGNAEVY